MPFKVIMSGSFLLALLIFNSSRWIPSETQSHEYNTVFNAWTWPKASQELEKEKDVFWRQGFVVLRQAFREEEMNVVKQVVNSMRDVSDRVVSLRDEQAKSLYEYKGNKKIRENYNTWQDYQLSDEFQKKANSSRTVYSLNPESGVGKTVIFLVTL